MNEVRLCSYNLGNNLSDTNTATYLFLLQYWLNQHWGLFPLLFGGTGPSLESIGAKKFWLVSGPFFEVRSKISLFDGYSMVAMEAWWWHKQSNASVDASGCWQEAAGVWGDLDCSKHPFVGDGWAWRVIRCIQIWKYIITHLLLVQFGPFQCCSLLFRRYPDAATWEEVCSCTTGGEQVWRSVGDGGAIFLCRWQRWLLGRQQWMGW